MINAISRFAITFIVTAMVITALGLIILAQQEFAVWAKIGAGVSLLAGFLSALIPTKNKSIFIVFPLLLALVICYFLLSSY